MARTQINDRLLKGSKSYLLISVFTVPLVYLLNILLARIGPNVLGIYVSIQLFRTILSSFIIFGSYFVINVFWPKIDKANKAKFLNFYFLIIGSFLFIFYCIVYFYPEFLKFFLKEHYSKKLVMYFLVFAPLFIIRQLGVYILNASFKYKKSLLLDKIINIFMFIIVLFFFLFKRDFIAENPFIVIVLSILILEFIVSFFSIANIKKIVVKWKSGFYIPDKFWNYSGYVYITIVISFLYQNIAYLYIIDKYNVKILGIYQTIVILFNLLMYMPILLNKVIIPAFSDMLKVNDNKHIRVVHRKLQRYIVFYMFVFASVVLIFRNQILFIFGKEYVQYSIYFIPFYVALIFNALNFANIGLLNARKISNVQLIANLLNIIFQVMIIIILRKFQIWNIVIGRNLGIIVSQLYIFFYVRDKFSFNLGREEVTMLLLMPLIIFSNLNANINLLIRIGISLIIIGIFWKSIHFSLNEAFDLGKKLIEGKVE